MSTTNERPVAFYPPGLDVKVFWSNNLEDNGKLIGLKDKKFLWVSPAYFDRLINDFNEAICEPVEIKML